MSCEEVGQNEVLTFGDSVTQAFYASNIQNIKVITYSFLLLQSMWKYLSIHVQIIILAKVYKKLWLIM